MRITPGSGKMAYPTPFRLKPFRNLNRAQVKVGCNLGEWRYFPKPAARGTLNRVEVISLA